MHYYPSGLSLALLSIFVQSTCHAFIAPRPLHTSQHTLHALPPQLVEGFTSSLLMADDVGIDQAFSDSIVTFDGPIKTMVIGFGVVVLVLAGLKALTGSMDAAIEQVLVDFEATLKRFYPQRWEAMAKKLEGLVGDERQVKLLSMMDELQEKEPAFMTTLNEKIANKGS